MGEAVVSSNEVMEVELQEKEERKNERDIGDEEDKEKKSSSGVIRWGRFVPRMVLRVLLVEADDSTRQIIAALLRKCSYRVVAVSDGLKAWEALKGGPQNVDLILTEVDLPSISGFALLTLIMEDVICKKIPVVMMSSHDSISVVLKCMLKGAADFLIKPVRKNELRNLWQHVWRRNTPTGEHVPQNISIAQNKVEVSSENNTASIHSGEYVVSVKKKKECSERGSDAQSSSTTPYMEAESAYMEKMQGFSQMKCSNLSNLSSKETRNHDDHIESDKEPDRLGSLTGGKMVRLESDVALGDEGYHSAALRWEDSHRDSTDITGENHGCNEKRTESSNGAIDLISTFSNHPKDCNQFSSSNDGINKDGFAPQLELSLRRFQPCGSKTRGSGERHTLNHSNSSAFSWYNTGKELQPIFPQLTSNYTEPKEDANYSQERIFNQLPENAVGTSERRGAIWIVTQGSMTTPVIGQSNQAGAAFPTSQLGLPAQGENILEPMEETSHGSPVAGQSASGSFCNGAVSHVNSNVHGSIYHRSDSSNPTSNGAVMRTTAFESVNGEDLSSHDGLKGMDSLHSTQREAALIKFRLKRKDRCFQKKVRYQSRKRLAEQRPRVKGQFVRQVQTETQTANG